MASGHYSNMVDGRIQPLAGTNSVFNIGDVKLPTAPTMLEGIKGQRCRSKNSSLGEEAATVQANNSNRRCKRHKHLDKLIKNIRRQLPIALNSSIVRRVIYWL